VNQSKKPEAWRETPIVAWTQHDGVGRLPNRQRRVTLLVLAGALTAVWLVLLGVDAFCPEHRAWVQTLAVGALVTSIASITGLVTSRAWSPFATCATAILGIVVGLIDAVHSPPRGALIATAFGCVALVVGVLSIGMVRNLRWDAEAGSLMANDVSAAGEFTKAGAEAVGDVGAGQLVHDFVEIQRVVVEPQQR
jgi:hypothetical protein